MASACVNNIGVPPETFIDCPPPAALMAYGWLSTSREYADDGDSKPRLTTVAEASDPSKDVADFEFRLDDDPVTMLPADELFSDGKLVPLQLTAVRPAAAAKSSLGSEVRSSRGGDPCLFSPKAPRCSSRWRDLLGLKKRDQNSNKATSSSSSSSTNNSGKSIRQFLLRNTKSLPEAASDASLNLPLLKDSDYESLSVSSSRLSLSSSSSGHEYDDLHRLSLDSDSKNSQSHIPLPRNSNQGPGHARIRMVKPRMIPGSVSENPKPLIDHPYGRASRSSIRRAQQDPAASTTGISADSPRMSSSGKIVFQSLERSSSSPSSLNGGQRYKHKGMERSYSAHVRVTPVLNVPVCSLRGASNGVFGLFSKKDGNSKGHQHNHNHHHHHHHTGRVKRGTVGRDGEG